MDTHVFTGIGFELDVASLVVHRGMIGIAGEGDRRIMTKDPAELSDQRMGCRCKEADKYEHKKQDFRA